MQCQARVTSRIQYLNTDLVLTSPQDIAPIATALEAGGIFALHITPHEDSVWSAAFETEETFINSAHNIAAFLDVIESFSPDLKEAWFECQRREFDVGYDCGDEPWAFNQGLSPELLGRVSAAGASLRVTLYPTPPDS